MPDLILDLPPQDLDAEQSVLGCILLRPGSLVTAAQYLKPHDFYDGRNETVYRTLLDLAESGVQVDSLTLADRLRGAGDLDRIGVPYLARLMRTVPTAVNIKAYCDIVKRKSLRRQLIKRSMTLGELAKDEGQELETVMAEAVDFLTMEVKTSDILPFGEELGQMRKRLFGSDYVTGRRSGIIDIDSKLSGGGFRPNDLIILGGRPSMGKTSFALWCAWISALNMIPVLVISTDDSKDDILLKFCCLQARLEYKKVLDNPALFQKEIADASAVIENLPVTIAYHPGITTTEIMALSKRLRLQGKCDLVIIDYFQHIDHQQKRGEGEVSAKSKSSVAIKNLAQILGVPVLLVSQLSRRVEERGGTGRPILSDLRETGQLEQDAAVVFLMHRQVTAGEWSKVVEMDLAKQKRGPRGRLCVGAVWETGEFYDLERDEVREYLEAVKKRRKTE